MTEDKNAIQREAEIARVVRNGYKDIQKIFNLVLNKWTKSKFNDTIYDFTRDAPLLERAISKQHRRVLRAFGRNYRDSLNEYLNNTETQDLDLKSIILNKEQDKEITDSLVPEFNHHASNRSVKFSHTILQNYQRAVEEKQRQIMIKMRGVNKTDNSTTEEQDSALLTRTVMRRNHKFRSKLISSQETRETSEYLNQTEGITTEMYYKKNTIAVIQSKKQWHTMGDNRVRGTKKGSLFNHVHADGQIVNIGEPFIVSGQKLMYPKDSSRGASLGNTINCRCVSTPVWDYKDFIIYTEDTL